MSGRNTPINNAISLTNRVCHKNSSIWLCVSMATLNDLITEAGLRKKELADQSGVDVATIIRIGNGKATTRVTVVKLVRILEKYLDRNIDIDSIEGLNINK